jgi:hypothetical protein
MNCLEANAEKTKYMLIKTNKMQHNTIFFITVKALHVSGGFPAHHKELSNKEYCITPHLVGYN